MMNHNERITYFGETDSRGKKVKFGIKAKDRTKHMYVVGKTGMGKSTLLENMAIQDIQNGEGLAFLDPHGGTAEKLLEYIPEERIQDVLYFAPFDLENPISFNVMENVEADKRHLVASGLMSVFEKIWEDAWSARMAYILNNTILALLEYPDATLLGINRMLADKDYRKKVVENLKDPSVKSFWIDEFGKYTERFAAEATPAIQNKVGQFTSNTLMRNIIGQPKSAFDLREIMDTKKILIVNLSKGRVGEGNVNLLGSMLITKIYLAAMSRADVSASAKENLPNFYLYVDEFQSFANKSFADILSEARKYKLNLTIAHQYIEQMSDEVRAAVFGNVGTMITFRVGAIDAEVLEKEFAPTFTAEDLVNLGFIQIYLKLMIDGVSSQPFSATSLATIAPTHPSFKEKAITFSREFYGKPRALVEEKIKQWHEPVTTQTPKPKAPPSRPSADTAKLQKTYKPYRPQTITQPKVEKIEKDIPKPEKTISLNNLKSMSSVHTLKTQKEPSKENRLDLRNALASVMKEKTQYSQPQNEKKIIQQYRPFDKAHGRPFDTRPSISDKRRDLSQTKEPIVRQVKLADETDKSEIGTPLKKPGVYLYEKDKSTKIKEVPEATLRKILDVDNESE